MRSSSLTRVVMASLGVSVVISLGCGDSPTGPSKQEHFSAMMSLSPNVGPISGATVVEIRGIGGFHPGAAVFIGTSRVVATVISAHAISVVMPAHTAGSVDVTVIRAPGLVADTLPGAYRFVGPPVIGELLPNIGSTGGGTPIVITGEGFRFAETVSIGGVVRPIGWDGYGGDDALYATTPAHAAGTAEVIVTDKWGQSGSGVFTFASPATFDFNGDWQGWTGPYGDFLLALTVQDNTVVSASCGGSSLTLAPAPVVVDGEFSFAGSDGVSITGKIVSHASASGTINTPSCVNVPWSAVKSSTPGEGRRQLARTRVRR